MTKRFLLRMSVILSTATAAPVFAQAVAQGQMHTLSTSPARGQELDLHRFNGATYPSLAPAQPIPCRRRHPFAHGRQETKLLPDPGQLR
jgi:hypothetical protein